MTDNKNTYTFKKYLSNKKLFRFSASLIFLISFAILFLLDLLFFKIYLKYPLVAAIIFFVSLIFLYREIAIADKELLNMARRNDSTWGRGSAAELVIIRSLEKLGSGYKVINDFQTGNGNIDHICVGPTGVFTIETKAHKGTISYDGKLKRNNQEFEKDFLKQAKSGCYFVDQLIKEKIGKDYFIIPIIIFANARIDKQTINHQIEGVWVGGREFECWVIENNKNTLQPEEINAIYDLLLKEGRKEAI